MINVYYNPKTNKMALGVFYTYADMQFYLITGNNKDESLKLTSIQKTWLDGWEYIGVFEDDYENKSIYNKIR